MGISIVVKDADFSANKISNAFFPAFQSLVGAKFYGTEIPDIAGLKKSKNPGAVMAGGGSVVVDDYGLVLGAGQKVGSGLSLPPSFTLMLVQDMTLPDNVFREIAATSIVDGSSGSVYIRNMRSSTDVWSEVGVWPNGHSIRMSAPGVSPSQNVGVTTFLDYDDTDNAMRLATVISGKRTQSGVVNPATAIMDGKELLLTRIATASASKARCVAVFNRVLTSDEQMEVHAWVSKFYSAKGVVI